MKNSKITSLLFLYIGLYCLLGSALLAVLAWVDPPRNWWNVAWLLSLTILFSTWNVSHPVSPGKMTLVNASVCLALLWEGAHAATLCALLGAACSTALRQDTGAGWPVLQWQPAYRYAFNLANCALASGIACTVYVLLLATDVEYSLRQWLALAGFSGVYFLVNTLGISVAIDLERKIHWRTVWVDNFLWTGPGFLAASCLAFGAQAAYIQIGPWCGLMLPPLYMIFRGYVLHIERSCLVARTQQDQERIQHLNLLNDAIVTSLATAIDAKDRYTSPHTNRLLIYARTLAEAAQVTGLELEAILTGALVHDVGKLGIPDHILGKPGKLTQEEYQRIQSHVTIGAEILAPIPFPRSVVEIVLTHHERWDGSGYPNGLQGEQIPIGGRIVALVDVFDALTSDRPYRRALPHDEALELVRNGAGTQFDPELVQLFIQIVPQAMAAIQDDEKASGQLRGEASPGAKMPSALEQIRQAAAEMAAVGSVMPTLAEQDSLEGIATAVAERALALLSGDTAVVYYPTGPHGLLRVGAVMGKDADRLGEITIPHGEGVAGRVAMTRQSIANAVAWPDLVHRARPDESLELRTATAVPVQLDGELVGVLTVYTADYNSMGEQQVRVLEIVAEQCGAAIQALRRQESERKLAYQDPLTGLANSRTLFRELERLTSGSSEARPFSLVMMDIDNFKQVNDRLGHRRGDQLLREIAQQVRSGIRPGDLCCRYAGDEFVVLLRDTGLKHAEEIGQRLKEAVDRVGLVDGEVQVRASVGVASHPEDTTDAVSGADLLDTADRRMYLDKLQQKDRIERDTGAWTQLAQS